MKISKTLFIKKKDNMPCNLTANIHYFYKTFHVQSLCTTL